jgi:hypothetical protein
MATKYEARDAGGQVFEIPAGTPFTTYWTPIGGVPTSFVVNHPWNALDLYSPNDLIRFGITASVVADPTPPRAQLPKSTVTSRVDAVGKLPVVFGILNSQPSLFAKWFAPDWPNVYVDDAGLLQVLAAAGLTADEIATVTAA